MLQIYIKLSAGALHKIGGALEAQEVIRSIDNTITAFASAVWGVPDHQIRCSAETLLYTRNECDMQIEVRYASSVLGFARDAIHPPSLDQVRLFSRAAEEMQPLLAAHGNFTCSFCTKPNMEGVYYK